MQQAFTLGPGAMVMVGVLVGIALLLMSTLGLVAVVVVLVGATLIVAGLDMRQSQASQA